MIHNDLLRKALRVQYTLLRTPLAVLDDRVVARYAPRDSMVQTSMDRTISLLDTVAERLLEPSSPSAPAGGLGPASRFAPAGAAGAAQPLPDEEREDVEQLAEDLLEAEQEQTFAGELAEDDDLRRVQAELRAKHTVEGQEESP